MARLVGVSIYCLQELGDQQIHLAKGIDRLKEENLLLEKDNLNLKAKKD